MHYTYLRGRETGLDHMGYGDKEKLFLRVKKNTNKLYSTIHSMSQST